MSCYPIDNQSTNQPTNQSTNQPTSNTRFCTHHLAQTQRQANQCKPIQPVQFGDWSMSASVPLSFYHFISHSHSTSASEMSRMRNGQTYIKRSHAHHITHTLRKEGMEVVVIRRHTYACTDNHHHPLINTLLLPLVVVVVVVVVVVDGV